MTDAHDEPAEVYQIRVRGRLDSHWSEWLGGLSVVYEDGDGCDTILCGPVVDQAALHGVLIKIRDLGVPLLAVQLIGPERDGVPAPPARQSMSESETKPNEC